MPSERRWIILAQDGRHVTMGRTAPPSEAEVEAAAAALAAQGLAGWLATLDGQYWSRRRVALAPVQMLSDGATLDWPAAVVAFGAARKAATTLRRRITPRARHHALRTRPGRPGPHPPADHRHIRAVRHLAWARRALRAEGDARRQGVRRAIVHDEAMASREQAQTGANRHDAVGRPTRPESTKPMIWSDMALFAPIAAGGVLREHHG